jgi:hypothetical protein
VQRVTLPSDVTLPQGVTETRVRLRSKISYIKPQQVVTVEATTEPFTLYAKGTK